MALVCAAKWVQTPNVSFLLLSHSPQDDKVRVVFNDLASAILGSCSKNRGSYSLTESAAALFIKQRFACLPR